MRQPTVDFLSKLPFHTLRESPQGEESVNARLLLRAGFISKTAAGIYSYLPLGLRVLHKIEEIVRNEMLALGSAEVLLPALHPRELWEKTGRWSNVDVLYKMTSRSEADYCMGPTHEEVVTPVASELAFSYRDLPLSLFQIQTKFRDEPRPRSGLLRGREFRMKDMYSFHENQGDLDRYYAQVTEAYRRVFNQVGIGSDVILTFASGGVFSKFSHEFQLLAPSGEDTIFVASDRSVALNKEVATDTEALRLVFGEKVPTLSECRAIEVGNIFQLGTRFSESFGMSITNNKGEKIIPLMGSYGLGTSRLLGAIAEINNDEKGLRWSLAVAPYDIHILVIPNIQGIDSKLETLLSVLSKNYQVLVDDRTHVRAGEKFADADLIGLPLRIVIGKRTSEYGEVELSLRSDESTEFISIENLGVRLAEIFWA